MTPPLIVQILVPVLAGMCGGGAGLFLLRRQAKKMGAETEATLIETREKVIAVQEGKIVGQEQRIDALGRRLDRCEEQHRDCERRLARLEAQLE